MMMKKKKKWRLWSGLEGFFCPTHYPTFEEAIRKWHKEDTTTLLTTLRRKGGEIGLGEGNAIMCLLMERALDRTATLESENAATAHVSKAETVAGCAEKRGETQGKEGK